MTNWHIIVFFGWTLTPLAAIAAIIWLQSRGININ